MTLDLDRITHPLRLAAGSHEEGSGKGCAMNVISYINGDAKITDYPQCSARPISRMVQLINDRLADRDGYLSPENSLIALDLGWLTVGTSSASTRVTYQWINDVLVDPDHGVLRFARTCFQVMAITEVARLFQRAIAGLDDSTETWQLAEQVAVINTPSLLDPRTAYAAIRCAEHSARVGGSGVNNLALAQVSRLGFETTIEQPLSDRIEYVRWAILRWRELMELDDPTDVEPAAVDMALARING